MACAHFQDPDAVNVMIDLETLGTSAGCAILSIGAQTFRSPSRFYYEKIDPKDSRLYLREDIETLRWWNKQDRRMRDEAFSGTKDLLPVLINFAEWLKDISPDPDKLFVWGNGADFDQPFLQHAYKEAGVPVPWKFWDNRCLRTLKNLPVARSVKLERAGVYHNALDDAIHQANLVCAIWRLLPKK